MHFLNIKQLTLVWLCKNKGIVPVSVSDLTELEQGEMWFWTKNAAALQEAFNDLYSLIHLRQDLCLLPFPRMENTHAGEPFFLCVCLELSIDLQFILLIKYIIIIIISTTVFINFTSFLHC